MRKTIIAIAFASLVLGSCNYKFIRTGTHNYEPVPYSTVAVFQYKAEVPGKFESVGVEICHTNKEHKALRKAKKAAAQHGANAIYVMESKEITNGQKTVNALLGTGMKGKYKYDLVRIVGQ